ncbi:pyrroline-5-carboxylate reductase [Mesorhizobium sp.]|uniref:pyrroline-5-carboxylate reductase n=1 Tax=Mesorhizobium sp. TaxID=1871066 RepID=UPI000FE8739C|nr:pyrroline-5-carboxylate reductase [Mesorhizobium sp.]RWB69965.1 MAG: pyrroline-5-carboxylate reductase [Mesorhizobium sp.]
MAHIVLIGAGNMGFAMLSRWLAPPVSKSEVMDSKSEPRHPSNAQHTFSVVEPVEQLRERAAKAGAVVYEAIDQLAAVSPADVMVIATKPATVPEIAELCGPVLSPSGFLLSVAAGVQIAAIEKRAGRPCAVIRCMPNTPASVGEGMIVCCPGSRVSADHRSIALELLSSVGKVVFVEDESLMDAVTAVSGSGPAYLFFFIEALTQAARSVGLPDDLALLLAKQTVYGASKLAMETPETPATLRRQVTSPNGTTAAGLDVLMRPGIGLTNLMNQAVSAARNRSVKLSESA